ncbi:hypothetical protein HPP92_025799 [Vanilla planifolia]|uniref:Uncharacterized protein n=1 Tax=Vanilla planifolia TaxID=51239 RepID=A0A835UAH5_VANPL|nr:hypothetical protein HPP92_026093 [Vanilla planifolia]KAG0452250.1 hypothetical protein HPP92_025799 [Vanilla planifolia]
MSASPEINRPSAGVFIISLPSRKTTGAAPPSRDRRASLSPWAALARAAKTTVHRPFTAAFTGPVKLKDPPSIHREPGSFGTRSPFVPD